MADSTPPSDEKNRIAESLKPMIAEARNSSKWLWCNYQDLWFSPDDLAKANAEGRFLWGPVNWQLRDPREHLQALEREAERAHIEAERFRKELAP